MLDLNSQYAHSYLGKAFLKNRTKSNFLSYMRHQTSVFLILIKPQYNFARTGNLIRTREHRQVCRTAGLERKASSPKLSLNMSTRAQRSTWLHMSTLRWAPHVMWKKNRAAMLRSLPFDKSSRRAPWIRLRSATWQRGSYRGHSEQAVDWVCEGQRWISIKKSLQAQLEF